MAEGVVTRLWLFKRWLRAGRARTRSHSGRGRHDVKDLAENNFPKFSPAGWRGSSSTGGTRRRRSCRFRGNPPPPSFLSRRPRPGEPGLLPHQGLALALVGRALRGLDHGHHRAVHLAHEQPTLRRSRRDLPRLFLLKHALCVTLGGPPDRARRQLTKYLPAQTARRTNAKTGPTNGSAGRCRASNRFTRPAHVDRHRARVHDQEGTDGSARRKTSVRCRTILFLGSLIAPGGGPTLAARK